MIKEPYNSLNASTRRWSALRRNASCTPSIFAAREVTHQAQHAAAARLQESAPEALTLMRNTVRQRPWLVPVAIVMLIALICLARKRSR